LFGENNKSDDFLYLKMINIKRYASSRSFDEYTVKSQVQKIQIFFSRGAAVFAPGESASKASAALLHFLRLLFFLFFSWIEDMWQ
jgi:hypothetical protein